MKNRTRRNSITKTYVQNFVETSHWVFAIAPLIALILATLFGKDKHILEFTFIFLAILVNFIILWLRSKVEEDKELSLFRTFWTNNLLPNQSGTEQRYNVEIAVVEDTKYAHFRDDLQKRFKKEPDLEKCVLVEVKDTHLYFRPIIVNRPTEGDEKKIEDDFKTALDTELRNATAVVVVRTKDLEKRTRVYQALESWSYEHSDVPILFAKKPNDKSLKNEIADRYLQIPDDPKSLPWRLLQRAKDRALAWRSQASFNRAMVVNIFYFSFMCIYIGAFWIDSLKEEIQRGKSNHYTAIQQEKSDHTGVIQNIRTKFEAVIEGMRRATETKEKFEQDYIIRNNAKVYVSYWFRQDGKPFVFVSTENDGTTNWFENDKRSLIGCGFYDPSKVVECKGNCDKPANIHAFDFEDKPVPNHGCTMKPRPNEPISSIVCVSYQPSGNSSPDATVGICIFTMGGKPNLVPGYHAFLQDRVRDFEEKFRERIKNKIVTSLYDRLRGEF